MMNFTIHNRRLFPLFITFLLFFIIATALLGTASYKRASANQLAPVYFPVVHSSSRLAPVPGVIASVSLGDAKCPHDIAYNQHSGILYITNEDSKNVSIIRDNVFAGHIATGKWPKFVASDPFSNEVTISHVWDGIRVMNGTDITASIPGYVESYAITINSVNGYTYVTDLGKAVTVIRDNKRVTDLRMPDYNDEIVIAWQLATDYDKKTGLTYFASWQHGILSIVDGLSVVDQFLFDGEGAFDMAIDSHRKLAFITNARAYADENSPNNISIVNLNNKQVKSIFSAKHSLQVALDPVTGYAYVTNPENDSVTVLQGTREIATYETGKKPRGVAVDSITGLAYVTNADDNSVSVFRDGLLLETIELPEDKGFEPHDVTIDEETGRVFILNRSSKEKPTYPDTEVTICKEPWVHILQ